MPIKKLLSSVVEITRQRDQDSLEFSLVATLAELLPVSKVSFYRTEIVNGIESLEEVVHLDTAKNEKGDLEFLWKIESPIVKAEGDLKRCLQQAQVIELSEQQTRVQTILVPMQKDKEVVGILSVSSKQSLDTWKPMVEGFVRIYENYRYILDVSEHDALTGLLNRRSFDSRLSKLLDLQQIRNHKTIEQDKRQYQDLSAPAWLVVIDVDHFKQVNDKFGHMYGDEVLLLLSQLMTKAFRQSDLLFRFGGEEFVVILAPTKNENALAVLDRFRQRVADYSFPQVGQVTISIGYAQINERDYPPNVLDKADKALYYAKSSGRNQVCGYESLIASGELTEHTVASDVELF